MKKPVNIFVLHNLLGELLSLNDDQVHYLMTVDNHDPLVLRSLIRRYIAPNFESYNDVSKEVIKASLEYFLANPEDVIERVLPSCQVQIEPPSGRYFFLMIWQELFGQEFLSSSVHLDDYEEVAGVGLANNLSKR